MHLLVGIPAFNESATIATVIERVPKSVAGFDQVTIVVVDDGSTDDTAALAAGAGAAVVRHHKNSGVGAAFQSICRFAVESAADVLVTLDGDGQFNPDDIPALVAPILAGDALVCTASRFADKALVPTMPWIKKWGNARVAGLVNMLTGERYADVSCGFRAYARDALLRMTVYHSFTYTHETFLDLAAKRIPIREVPLKVRGVREHGKSKVASSVLRYGARTSAIMLRTYRDHRPLQLLVATGILPAVLGVGLMALSLAQFFQTGRFLKWAAFSGAGMLALAVTLVFFGFLLDITTRIRQNQEELLYWLRRNAGEPR